MSTFLLIHGAWHARWCWERIVPLLERAGHTVLAPDLAGMGGAPLPAEGPLLAAWGRQIAELALAQPEPVALVGHSRGGLVISQAAEYAPQAISRLVYLAAFLVPDGGSLWSALQQVDRPATRPPDLEISADGSETRLREEAIASSFYNTTPEEWRSRAALLVEPEPMSSFTETLALSAMRFGRVPRSYIECLRDRAIPIELQRMMRAALPCDRVTTLDCDHSPFYSCPEQLAGVLLDEAAATPSALTGAASR